MNYNKLATEIHQTAVSKGWYKDPRSTDELLTLIHSEMFEAFEGYRGDKWARIKDKTTIIENLEAFISSITFSSFFQLHIKDTVEDEIADTVIRTLDMAAYLEIEIPEVKNVAMLHNFPNIQKTIGKTIIGFYDEQMTGEKIAILLGLLQEVSSLYGFDFEAHIRLKMAYNATRSYRHGNKVI